MINMGRNVTDMNWFHHHLQHSHKVYINIQMFNHQMQVLGDISHTLVNGSVDMDASADITRSAKLLLLDPFNALGLDYRSPSDGVNFYNRLIRIHYGVGPIEDPTSVISVPIFTGPITDVKREGPVLSIDCQGKEVLATEGILRDLSWPAHWPKSLVMLNYLRDYLGEVYNAHDEARSDLVLQQDWAVEAGTNLWPRFREMAHGMGLQLFYDAWGTARLRQIPAAAVWEFNESNMTSPADVTFDIDSVVNVVRVTGGSPEGYSGRYVAEAHAPANHPLNAHNLARTPGIPRYIPEFVNDDSLLSDWAVQNTANTILHQRLIQAIDTTFTASVIPHLEEMDWIQINSSRFWGRVQLHKFSIPLVGDGDMSVGFLSTSKFGVGALSGISSILTEIPSPPIPEVGPAGGKKKGGDGKGGKYGHGWGVADQYIKGPKKGNKGPWGLTSKGMNWTGKGKKTNADDKKHNKGKKGRGR